MAETDIATIGIAVDSSQVDASTAALDRWLAKGAEVDAMLGRLAAGSAGAMKGMSPAMAAAVGPSPAGGTVANPFGSAWTQSVTGATSGYVGLTAAAKAASAATLGHSTAAAAGASALTSFAGAAGHAGSAAGAQANAVAGSAAAHRAHGAAVGLNSNKLAELHHVLRAVTDEMMAGRSMIGALGTESGRLFDIFGPGTARIQGFVKAFGEIPLVTKLAGGGMLAFAASSAIAFVEYEAQQDRLERSLNGVGRRSGATLGDLQATALRGAAAGRLSIGEATNLTAGFTGAGLTPDLTGSLVGLTRDYGRVTGLGTEKGGAALEKAFADPVRGLADLDKQLGFVDAKLQDQIDILVRSGHLHDAQAVALEGLRKALDDTRDTTWAFRRGLEGVETWIGNKFSAAGAAVAGAFGLNSDADKLAELRTRADNLQRVDPIGNADYVAEIRKEMLPLMASVTASEQKAAADKRQADAIFASKGADTAVRSLFPEIGRSESLAATIEVLRQATADSTIRDHMGLTGGLAGRAYDNARMMQVNADPERRARQDYGIRIAGVGEMDLENRGLLDARRAELAVLRETGDALRAATAGQRSLNESIEAANTAAAEKLRQTKLDVGLIGLSPYERARQEIRNRFDGPDGEIERNRFDRGGNNILNDREIRRDLTEPFAPARIAVTGFTEALDKAAGRLAAFPPAGAGPFGALSPMKPNDGVGPFYPQPFNGSAGPVSDHERTMVDLLVKAGFTNRAADAGFVGGMAGESGTGLDPSAHNASGHRGIMQWEPSRFAGASAFGDPGAFMSQAQLAIRELQTSESAAGAMLRNATTIQGGLAANLRAERPAQDEIASSYSKRLAYGTAVGADLAGLTPRDTAPSVLTIHPAVRPAMGLAEAAARLPTSAEKPIASTSATSTTGIRDALLGGADKTFASADPSAFGTPLGDASRRLQEQGALADLTAGHFGQLDLATRSAIEGQKLWQSYFDSGATKTMHLSDATGGLADATRKYGLDAAEAAMKAEDLAKMQRGVAEASDMARNGISSIFSGGLSSMLHGQGFGAGAKSALASFGEQLISKSVSGAVNFATGGAGNPLGGPGGGGFLSSLMSMLPHFASGTQDAGGGPTIVGEAGPELVDMPAHAEVYNASQTQGLMDRRSATSTPALPPTIVQVYPVGGAQFTPDQIREMRGHIASGVADGHARIQRNFPQFQADARQY